MKKIFAATSALAVAAALVSVAPAQTVVQNFDALTAGTSLGSAWGPTFSGSSNVTNGTEGVSDEQAVSGANSAKLTWDWGASGTLARIQPTTLVETALSDHTGEPWFSIAVFGDSSGAEIELYMCDTGNNAGYEAVQPPTPVTWTGWELVQYNISTATVIAWITGDGTLNVAACEWCGIFFRQGTAAAGPAVFYMDDIQYSTTELPSLQASVENWSVIKY